MTFSVSITYLKTFGVKPCWWTISCRIQELQMFCPSANCRTKRFIEKFRSNTASRSEIILKIGTMIGSNKTPYTAMGFKMRIWRSEALTPFKTTLPKSTKIRARTTWWQNLTNGWKASRIIHNYQNQENSPQAQRANAKTFPALKKPYFQNSKPSISALK